MLGADEKVLVIVGDAWDWNAPKRLLNAVTEACALHIRRESLMTKFNSSHMNSLTSLKTMRFLFNDFTNLKQVIHVCNAMIDCIRFDSSLSHL